MPEPSLVWLTDVTESTGTLNQLHQYSSATFTSKAKTTMPKSKPNTTGKIKITEATLRFANSDDAHRKLHNGIVSYKGAAYLVNGIETLPSGHYNVHLASLDEVLNGGDTVAQVVDSEDPYLYQEFAPLGMTYYSDIPPYKVQDCFVVRNTPTQWTFGHTTSNTMMHCIGTPKRFKPSFRHLTKAVIGRYRELTPGLKILGDAKFTHAISRNLALVSIPKCARGLIWCAPLNYAVGTVQLRNGLVRYSPIVTTKRLTSGIKEEIVRAVDI